MPAEITIAVLEKLDDTNIIDLYRESLSRVSAINASANPISRFWDTEGLFLPLLAARTNLQARFEPFELQRKQADELLKRENSFIGVLDYHLFRASTIVHHELRKQIAAQTLYYVGIPLLFTEVEGVAEPVDQYAYKIRTEIKRINGPQTAQKSLLIDILKLNKAIVGKVRMTIEEKTNQKNHIRVMVTALGVPMVWENYRTKIGEIDNETARSNIERFKFLATQPDSI